MSGASSTLNNLHPMWLRAIAIAGSGGNKGAVGLMQIRVSAVAMYGITNPYDPVQSIYGGARILNDAMTKAEQIKASGRDINPADHALRMYLAGMRGRAGELKPQHILDTSVAHTVSW